MTTRAAAIKMLDEWHRTCISAAGYEALAQSSSNSRAIAEVLTREANDLREEILTLMGVKNEDSPTIGPDATGQ